MSLKRVLAELNVNLEDFSGKDLAVHSPIDGKKMARLKADSTKAVNEKIRLSVEAFKVWRDVPAPKRAELIRHFGNELRDMKKALAKLITMESGKIFEEALGEVQEMIDICDFAVGLSRTIGGLTLPSERPEHSMQENWFPLGPVGVISAFNFPAAVWAWNFAIAIVCGDSVIWKPSEKTPLTALACQSIFKSAAEKFSGKLPECLSQIIIGHSDVGETLVADHRIRLISATGSSRMGKNVGQQVAKRCGKSLLELGGNNAVVITPSADFDIVLPSVVFGAVGTAGQRCTTTRRAFVHVDIYNKFFEKLRLAYDSLGSKIGDPMDRKILIGPLIDRIAYQNMQDALDSVQAKGGKIYGGKMILERKFPDAYYVQPALVKIDKQVDIIRKETFAPILYVMPYENIEQAMDMLNDVPQGLSSSIFTNDVREAEIFKKYSDCGIANVNIGTSGAEIGGAFGGEKETGGGRESGSDSWKAYMRRQTNTTYYGEKPAALAQGIKFAW